jgi:ABC-2 type transport system permease protein/oleandomycin transport system permease protein
MTTATLQPATYVRPLKRSRFVWALTDAWAIAKRRLIQTPRIPDEIVFATIQPIMFVLLFRFVFGSSITIPGVNYVDYLLPGIFVQTVIFGSVTTGIGLAQDLEKGLIDRFRSLPMAKSAVLTGRTIADLVRNAFVVLVMFAVGLLVGYRPTTKVLYLFGGIALLLLISFAFSWVSAAIGLAVHSVEAAQSAGFIWLFPLTFASSAFVLVATLPDWLRAFAVRQPVTRMVDAVRGLLLGHPAASDVWSAVAWCVGILVVFIPLSVWMYGRRVGR